MSIEVIHFQHDEPYFLSGTTNGMLLFRYVKTVIQMNFSHKGYRIVISLREIGNRWEYRNLGYHLPDLLEKDRDYRVWRCDQTKIIQQDAVTIAKSLIPLITIAIDGE